MLEFSWQRYLDRHILYTRGAQVPSARLPRQQHFVLWHLMFVYPECVTLLAPRIWRWLLDFLKIAVTCLTLSSLWPLLLLMSVMGSLYVWAILPVHFLSLLSVITFARSSGVGLSQERYEHRSCGLHDSCRSLKQIIRIVLKFCG
jgi:hypothetical protein